MKVDRVICYKKLPSSILGVIKSDHTPFVIAENLRQFYYLGLSDWRKGRHARLLDTCRTGQDVFILGLKQFGHVKLAEKAEAQMTEEGVLTRRRGETEKVCRGEHRERGEEKMNKLEKLIAKLSLDGVEYKPLGEVCVIKNGKDYKSFGAGPYPVYGSGGVMTYVDRYVYDKPTVLIPRKGSIENLFYVDKPFWNVDTIFYIVARLEGFDKLCNSMTEGLPGEIALCKQQYEFYRDQLLNFRCAEHGFQDEEHGSQDGEHGFRDSERAAG